jgi:serine phosphatase RsbU (regulator of sigma subunit)
VTGVQTCALPISETVRRSNDTIIEDAGAISFVTLLYAVFDEARTLTYVNAGHNPPVLRRRDGSVETLEPTGPVIGFLEGVEFEEVTITLQPGDLLVFYTDGVTEAENREGAMFGEERLCAVIDAAAGRPWRSQERSGTLSASLLATLRNSTISQSLCCGSPIEKYRNPQITGYAPASPSGS